MSNASSASPYYVPATMGMGLRATAARDPEKVALTDDDGNERTYRDFIANVNRIAHYVHSTLGLGRGDHSAIALSNSFEFLEIAIGLSEAIVPPAMINPRATKPEIEHICNDSGAKVLFTERKALDNVRAANLPSVEHIICIEDDLPDIYANHSADPLGLDVQETDIYSIPYTSGTTGKPKGVLLSHRARVLMMLFAQAGSYLTFSPDCKGLATMPFFNGGGISNALTPLFFGGLSHISSKFDPKRVLDIIAEKQITNVFMVPTQFHAVLGLGDEVLKQADVSSLRLVLSSAAPLPQATKQKLVDFFGEGKLFDSYGSTEFGSATALRPYDQLRKHACVGLAHPGCEVKLLDDNGDPVPQGEVGQVYARSPWMFSGYWNNDEATQAAFHDGWCTTGDLGRQDEDGYLYIVDRKKNVIITGGQNVFPQEVENVLYMHPAIREAAVIGRQDDYWGEAVTAVVALKPDASVTSEELKAHCAEQLSSYKIPKTFILRDELPKTGSGKIHHKQLREDVNEAV